MQVPGLSQEHQVLALSYTAEAVCHLEGTAQAAQQLQKALALQQVSSNGNHTQAAAANSSANPEVKCHFKKLLDPDRHWLHLTPCMSVTTNSGWACHSLVMIYRD